MAASEHLNEILFHASTNKVPPHKGKGGDTFHVGTMRAAIDRVSMNTFTDDMMSEYDENETPQVGGYMHVYEAKVPKGLRVHDDPHASGYDEYAQDDWDADNAIDESSVKDIAAYQNRHEDPGSVSYVMNKQMLRNKGAKFVGTMPFSARAEANDAERIMKDLGYD